MIEIVVAIGILAISIPAAMSMLLASGRSSGEMLSELRAASLAEEGIQASISIRDRGWNNLTVGNHGLAVQASPLEWIFQGSSDASEGFSRTITVSQVDLNTRKVTSSVNWASGIGRNATVEYQTLLTDWASL